MKYYINGWIESKSYFMSFGFTESEIQRMINGEIIKRSNNEYRIDKEPD